MDLAAGKDAKAKPAGGSNSQPDVQPKRTIECVVIHNSDRRAWPAQSPAGVGGTVAGFADLSPADAVVPAARPIGTGRRPTVKLRSWRADGAVRRLLPADVGYDHIELPSLCPTDSPVDSYTDTRIVPDHFRPSGGRLA